ncbi:3-deoxy-D-manno-octulosonic acid kinase [Thiohalophilus thiocyanatoxydans]|uniref:3-deoxy-D-manno-octulosonic acid kinase n=1 Tax=Thiohalophilus thiocyanatoxydans TaxID=381308 RepID=A0A4R8IQ42_9GAMM|nr:3-deoxy-D-manno-octulosonic acid kinase [Thiohalophilus thiocyanatoxydans]TDX99568.1 3-deoxy-D-manno-octulosonic acid kinase [Thiohalophilus thiocyanatoxydans]
MSFVTRKAGQRYIIYDDETFDEPEQILFTSDAWARRDAIVGFADGRGTTFFVTYQDHELALRHYHRGGLIARWSPDRYLWTGLGLTRAWREMHLLQRLRESGLPVPRPIAAQIVRHGLVYTADIMTRRIPGARALGGILTSGKLDAGQWNTLGKVIGRFHEQGVYHADLNANNILQDRAGRFYLIDFDRGVIKRRSKGWQQRNLQRLHRSLVKLRGANETFHFTEANWQELLAGYS